MNRSSKHLPFYLIPFLLGMCGVLFARQFPSPYHLAVILISVGAPLFVGGYLLAKLYAVGLQRYLLIAATLLLMLGALMTVSDVSGSLAAIGDDVPAIAVQASRWLGALSLLVGLLTILFSVTRAGEEIDDIGDRFRHLADHISEGFVLTAPDGTVAQVNSRFKEMTGLTDMQVIGHSARELAARFKLDVMMPHLDKRGKGIASEYQVTWRVGDEDREYWVSGTPIFNRRGAHTGTLATIRDITEQCRLSKSLERYAQGLARLVEEQTQKLHQSEGHLRDLLVHMNEGFLAIDWSFRVRFANERVCQMLEIPRESILGREVFEFVDSAGRGRLLDLFESIDARETLSAQQELTVNTAGGKQAPVVIAIAPIPDSAEEDLRYSVVITDVTKLKEMQRQLEVRAAELEAANEELKLIDRAKDSFLSNVTHELRTPLSTIRGYVEMLNSTSLGPLFEPQKNALTVMSRNVQRLTVLIDEMIAFSRMEIKGIQPARTLFSIQALLHECISSAQPQLLAKDTHIETLCPGHLPLVWADRKKLLQVLSVLLSNAVKFSPAGGLITVTVGVRHEHTLEVAVRDRGIGIDPAFHKRVFAKFFQVDSSLTRRHEGAGIGLSIAKNIIEAHGGVIELESELNQGSTFMLVLPNSLFSAAMDAPHAGSMAGTRVMMVADEREFCSAIADLLRTCGCEVSLFHRGYECLRVAREMMPDLIVLDEVLPDLSGAATFRRLKEEIPVSTIPALVLSGSPAPSTLAERDQGLAACTLAKPFSAGEFIAKVRHMLFDDPHLTASDDAESQDLPSKGRPSVLVVDKDTDVLEWVETALTFRQIPCLCAFDPGFGLRLAQNRPPSVIFVDVDTLDEDAVSTLARFHEAEVTRGIPVYAMTALPTERCAANGSAGILRKPFSIRAFVDIILEGSSRVT